MYSPPAPRPYDSGTGAPQPRPPGPTASDQRPRPGRSAPAGPAGPPPSVPLAHEHINGRNIPHFLVHGFPVPEEGFRTPNLPFLFPTDE